ncbi:fibronectin type III domain-containing protein [Saccharothrix luteola]|uniref:fibronectin type III domain-containing protein n=1 Tax=Saccharothrix luteola TaxID=2893018 RepID=UPI001E510A27|nr:fibronectin type III domain-containing protein [Saccharothrix luteola]MCC8246604.1 fibronectin type III domain-containing protein [Saccharothrix luteola]
MGAKLGRIARRAIGAGRRESASVSAAALGLLLLVGAALGDGISRTAVEVSDGLTWLNDDQRGEVVQVNPSSGKPQTRLQVSGADAQLEIAQSDDKLIVLDRRTGQITVIDLATLLSSGRRQAPPGPSAKVLIAWDRVFVVDRAAGSVHNADPVTLADIGSPWLAGQPLADVVADDSGVLWAVDHGGNLYSLEWSDEDLEFLERTNRAVSGAGPRTALVPHERGVTLLGLEGGVVVRDGTGRDLTASTASFAGEVLAAQTSPTGLVPASVPDASVVVLVSGDEVVRVDMAQFDCPKPGRPAVFRDRVYVPCLGSGKVVVLDRMGKRGADDVRTGGSGDPALVFDDGKLFINTPGSDSGVIVDSDGRTRDVVIRSPELPVMDPERSPIPSVPSPPPPRPEPPTRDNRGNGQNTQGRGGETTVAPTTTTPSAGVSGAAPGRPAGVTVSQRSNNGTSVVVTVSWSAVPDGGEPITGYQVTGTGAFSGGSQETRVAGTSAELVLPCAGSTFCASGKVDVAVAAYNRFGVGEAGTASWTIRPAAGTTTTQPPVVTTTTQPPVVTTTTTPPPVITTTTTTPPPPPPLPTGGVQVISTVGPGGHEYERRVTTAPPADWANHSGTCEVVNLLLEATAPIPCAGGSVTIAVDYGLNSIVVRAHGPAGSVESASYPVRMREPPQNCGGGRICQPLSVPASDESNQLVGGGIGLLATAWLLTFRNRRMRRGESE